MFLIEQLESLANEWRPIFNIHSAAVHHVAGVSEASLSALVKWPEKQSVSRIRRNVKESAGPEISSVL